MSVTVLVSIDGVAPRAVTPATAPNLVGLAAVGAGCFTATSVTPSLTLPAHASMLTGVRPEAHGYLDNDPASRAGAAGPGRGLFAAARDAGLLTAAVHPWSAMGAALGEPGPEIVVGRDGGYDPAEDRWTAREAARLIGDARPDLVFVYLIGPDLEGHRSGWDGEAYREAVAQADRRLGQVVRALSPEDQIVVTTDHGGLGRDHGAGRPEDLETFVVARSPRLSGPSCWSEASILDVAPTVTDLLGLDPDPSWVGRSMLGAERPAAEVVLDLVAAMAAEDYGEQVTMLAHSLQTAAVAGGPDAVGPDGPLALAALLHDVGHVVGRPGAWGDPDHASVGARFLQQLLPPSVVEPIRLHVDAKRYLVATDPGYRDTLSRASVVTLGQQGGPFDDAACRSFTDSAWAEAAVALRRADDGGKRAGLDVPPLDRYRPLLERHLDSPVEPSPTWARDACRCEACRDRPSDQHLLDVADLDGWSVTGVDASGPNLVVDVARAPDRSGPDPDAAARHRCVIPAPSGVARGGSGSRTGGEPSPARLWGRDHEPALRAGVRAGALDAGSFARSLTTDGLALAVGVPTQPGRVLEVAGALGFVRETNYGRLFDVMSKPDANNLAYTPVGLPLHTDNPYRDPCPTVQLLHCLQPADEGGATLLSDGFRAAEVLRAEDPEAFAVLTATPMRFRFHDAEVDLRAVRSLIELGPDGAVRAVSVNHRSMEAPDPASVDVERFYAAYRRFVRVLSSTDAVLELMLGAGDLIGFDNRRVLHARRPFSGRAVRHLQGCYIDGDAVRSLAMISAGGWEQAAGSAADNREA